MKTTLTLLCGLLLCFNSSVLAQTPYVLSDEDVSVNGNGTIIWCTYDFSNKEIVIPSILDSKVVRGIATRLFDNLGLISVQLPSTIEVIEKEAFAGNAITSLALPASLQEICESAFMNNPLTSIDFETGSRLSDIGRFAFYKNQISELCIPASVKRIGSMAFAENRIADLSFAPSCSIISLGKEAFANNTILNFVLPTPGYPEFSNWININGATLSGGTLVSDLASFYVVKIPYTLTDADVRVVDGVIQSCSYDFSANDIIIPERLDDQTVVGIADKDNSVGVFAGKGISGVSLPGSIVSIGSRAFTDNYIVDLILPDNLERLGRYAFSNNGIANLILPSVLEEIGWYALGRNCLQSLELPALGGDDFVHWINKDGRVFQGGDEIMDFNTSYLAQFSYTLTDADVQVVGGIIQRCYYDFSSKIIIIPDTLDGQKVKGIVDKFQSAGIFAGKGITSIELPSSMEVIGDFAFYDNGINRLFIPASVTTIKESAFNNNAMNEVVFETGSQLSSIEGRAFYDNSLTSVVIPSTVSEIGTFAFSLNSLSTVTILEDSHLSYIATFAFNNNPLNSLVLPITQREGSVFNGWKSRSGYQLDGGDAVGDFSTSYTAQFTPLSRIISLSGDLNFGRVDIGSTARKSFFIENTGEYVLTINSLDLPGGFSSNWGDVSVNPGESLEVEVVFLPVVGQDYSGSISIDSDATSGGHSIAVSGVGLIPTGAAFVDADTRVYSNPTHEEVCVSITDYEGAIVKVYTVSGELILNCAVQRRTELLDLSIFSSGVYVVVVEKNNRLVLRKKVVKD